MPSRTHENAPSAPFHWGENSFTGTRFRSRAPLRWWLDCSAYRPNIDQHSCGHSGSAHRSLQWHIQGFLCGLAVSNTSANIAKGYYDDALPSSFFDPTIITADDEDRTWRIGYTKAAIDFAAVVDSSSVCITIGQPLPVNSPEQTREYLFESLTEIMNYVESAGVSVGIGFEPELLIECTDEVLTLIDRIGSEALDGNLDIGYVVVYSEDTAESARRCAGHITGLHLEDIVGSRRGKHYHRIPGEGDIDFRARFGAIDDIDCDGYATLEL